MTNTSGRATAVTDKGEAPVIIDLRQKQVGFLTSEGGTVAISDTDVWTEIANTCQLRLRLPDGREGSFTVLDGAGMTPPLPGSPVRLRIERADGETF
ncbi:hypothetical protein [Streptomyces sp. NPDC096013]|uniref:hypothetical protein n=1 Tax=Streptomyces sp. NPDC096013 TaxID=3366069 RepID=UPI00380C2EFF